MYVNSVHILFTHCTYTVYVLKILKMGLTILFTHLNRVRLDSASAFFNSRFLLFFFFFARICWLWETIFTVMNSVYTVHTLYIHCLRIKKILKMDPTILFTHLKIILLQCFQFSVFSNNKFNPNTSYMLQMTKYCIPLLKIFLF